MKKEKVKENKNIFLMVGITASIVMIIIVLSFSLISVKNSASIIEGSITGNSIDLKVTGQSSKSYTEQEIDVLLEKKCLEIINNKPAFNALIMGSSGNGNSYACIDSAGKIFRSEIPCK